MMQDKGFNVASDGVFVSRHRTAQVAKGKAEGESLRAQLRQALSSKDGSAQVQHRMCWTINMASLFIYLFFSRRRLLLGCRLFEICGRLILWYWAEYLQF